MLDTLYRIARSMAARGFGPSAWILRSKPRLARSLQVTLQAGQHVRISLPSDVGEADHAAAADLGEKVGGHQFGGRNALPEISAGEPEEEGGDKIERIAEQRVQYAQEFGFAALIESAARLDFDGGSAVAHHSCQAYP